MCMEEECVVSDMLNSVLAEEPRLLPMLWAVLHEEQEVEDSSVKTTTVVLRYLPIGTTVRSLLNLLTQKGFTEGINLIFIPVYHMTMTPMRIAVINFVSEAWAEIFAKIFHNEKLPGMHKPFAVGTAKVQGLRENLAKILAWEFLAKSMPANLKPLLRVGDKFVSLPSSECAPFVQSTYV